MTYYPLSVAPAGYPAAAATAPAQSSPPAWAPPQAAPQVPAPPPPPPPPPAAAQPLTGLRMTGPWVAGPVYGVVPAGLLGLAPDTGEKGRWYSITKGKFVGVTQSLAVADAAVTRVSHAVRESFGSQAEAVAAFNLALASNLNLVEVV
ncbi:hypothetical protein DFH06DRAFT_1318730 [Mycena polygramma]|nr:hypothetical protein DFH06DRAFT_1119453 [Mycena polygramma]KAJ7983280.1 hypothetical protein DFH06DRAFT_1318730 [Mycena polygramma]